MYVDREGCDVRRGAQGDVKLHLVRAREQAEKRLSFFFALPEARSTMSDVDLGRR